MVDSFDDMGLREELLRGVYAYGFEKPSAIQQRAIMPCIKGHDVIAQAQSGTGKTATFAVSILERMDPSIKECQALVLAPTRELANQVCIHSSRFISRMIVYSSFTRYVHVLHRDECFRDVKRNPENRILMFKNEFLFYIFGKRNFNLFFLDIFVMEIT